MSFCTVPESAASGMPRRRATRHVEREEDRRRGVDRHRRGDPVERDAVEERLHVLEAVDRDPHLAHLAERVRVVGVVADLRGQVEGHGEPGRALLEEVAVAPVRLGGGAEAGVLPHRPQPPAVAGGVQAAGERVGAGLADRPRRRGGSPARRAARAAGRRRSGTRVRRAGLVMEGSR